MCQGPWMNPTTPEIDTTGREKKYWMNEWRENVLMYHILTSPRPEHQQVKGVKR